MRPLCNREPETHWLTLCVVVLCGLSASAAKGGAATSESDASTVAAVVVTSREDLTGKALTASQGVVTPKELELRPAYRVGQLLEAVPGLVVTAHSGEGKANQYLLRGENLDHGIDLANFVDGMPINRPTNAHGQGYSDLNFLIPELIERVSYTKGPYYADLGDFGGVGSEHMHMRNVLDDQISLSGGTLGDDEALAAGSRAVGGGSTLLGALEASHVDGPFTHPDNFRKLAAALRWSEGNQANGDSLTALFFRGEGRNTTDQPLRAIEDGQISRWGSLDPTDGNRSFRQSLSARSARSGEDGWIIAEAFAIHSGMTLWNNFTHFLNDAANGDQEQQDETRTTLGASLTLGRTLAVFSLPNQISAGFQDRYDALYVDRRHTRQRSDLLYCNDGDGDYSVGQTACTADRVVLNDAALFFQDDIRLTSWARLVLGLREEESDARDRSQLSGFTRGRASEKLAQPKGDLIFGPWFDTEIYASAGKGFHSDDVRGVLGTVPVEGVPFGIGRVPLMAKTWAEEIGLRNHSLPGLDWQAVVFDQIYSSEMIYDQDAGQDQATAPSRRQGAEISAQYRPIPKVELSADLASTRAWFFDTAKTLTNFYGIVGGTHIANAPTYTGSIGLLLDQIGPWSAGVEERILGPYPLTNGPANPRAQGYKETNITVSYALSSRLAVRLTVFNLLNAKAWAAEYYYATAITPAEVARYGTAGVNDYQVHPLEPLSARLNMIWKL